MKRLGVVLKEIGWDRKLADLANRIERMEPRRVDPDRYFEEKSEIANELRKMSRGEV